MTSEVRVGIIAGSAQILAALVALFGVLATAPDTSAARRPAPGSTTTPPAVLATPTGSVSCTDIVERYRRLVLLDSKVQSALATDGPDGVSPVEADPEARRCGVSPASLRAMR